MTGDDSEGGFPDAAVFAVHRPTFYSVVYVPRVNFQQKHVGRQSVLHGLPRPADRSHPLHNQPNACLQAISFNMSIPPQSRYHHIPTILHLGVFTFPC